MPLPCLRIHVADLYVMPCHVLCSFNLHSIPWSDFPCILCSCSTSNSLGLLASIISVLLLQPLYELDVCLLCFVGGETSVDDLLPGALLGLALILGRLLENGFDEEGGKWGRM